MTIVHSEGRHLALGSHQGKTRLIKTMVLDQWVSFCNGTCAKPDELSPIASAHRMEGQNETCKLS